LPQVVADPRFASHPFDGLPSQSPYPALHWLTQAPALHAGIACGSVTHAVQLGPHAVVDVTGTQAPPHIWNPLTHVKPQLVPSQVVVAFATEGHATQDDVPQVLVDVLLSQVPLHKW
jgi:hypothetical protein